MCYPKLSKHFCKVSDILASLVDCCHWHLNWHVQTWLGSPGLESSWGMFGISQGALLVPLQRCTSPFCWLSHELGAFNAFHSFFSWPNDRDPQTVRNTVIDLKRERSSVGSLLSSSASGSIYLFKWNLIDASKWTSKIFLFGKVCVT